MLRYPSLSVLVASQKPLFSRFEISPLRTLNDQRKRPTVVFGIASEHPAPLYPGLPRVQTVPLPRLVQLLRDLDTHKYDSWLQAQKACHLPDKLHGRVAPAAEFFPSHLGAASQIVSQFGDVNVFPTRNALSELRPVLVPRHKYFVTHIYVSSSRLVEIQLKR